MTRQLIPGFQRLIVFALFAAIVAGVPAFSVPNPDNMRIKSATMQETEATFKTLLPKLRTFTPGYVVFDRFQAYGKPRYSGPDGEVFAEIDSSRHATKNLLTLLKDGDPRMRTLALAALYSKENSAVLPDIAQLTSDTGKTYPEPLPLARAVPGDSKDTPVRDLTVGEVAQSIVRFYLEPAGIYPAVNVDHQHRSEQNQGFTKYWTEHKDRKHCASWFYVKLQKASTGCSPTDQTRQPQIAAVRRELNGVPSPDREWILLWLQTSNGFDLSASETDVLAAMKRLGADRLMLMLQSKMPSDDPDMQPRDSNNYSYQTMQLSVLKRAKKVLRQDQANALLACDKWEGDYQKHHRSNPFISPWWTIAAAELDPGHASKLLREEFSHLDEDFYGYQKADLAAALFRQCGLKENGFLIDRFYEESSRMNKGQHSFFRSQWLKELEPEGARCKPLLKQLVDDRRFDDLKDCAAVTALAQLSSKLTGKEIATDKLWHPLGVDAACDKLDAARQQYPKETKDLIEGMAQLRKLVRDSIG